MSIWCEISKKELNDNLNKIKKITNKKIVSVVKGNAYGLGLKEVAKLIEDNTDIYGVSSIVEADAIDTTKDILIMTPVCEIPKKPKSNYIYTIDSVEDISKFNKNEKYRVHIYVDTGMNRLGVTKKQVDFLVDVMEKNLKNIVIEGVYTHLHKATDTEQSKKQIDVLREIYEKHKNRIPNFHCLNSKGIVVKSLREYADFTNMARAGNALYGYDGASVGLNRVFKIKAKVVKRYIVREKGKIGYGAKEKVNAGTVVGVLNCGSIDKIGFSRNIKTGLIKDCLKTVKSNIVKTTNIYYNGNPIYQLCSPNMNCVLLDITNFSEIKEDSIVDLNISSIQIDSSIEKRYI